MAGWHHQLSGHEFEQTRGNGEGQGSLASCSLWGRKKLDVPEQLNNSNKGGRRRFGRARSGKLLASKSEDEHVFIPCQAIMLIVRRFQQRSLDRISAKSLRSRDPAIRAPRNRVYEVHD